MRSIGSSRIDHLNLVGANGSEMTDHSNNGRAWRRVWSFMTRCLSGICLVLVCNLLESVQTTPKQIPSVRLYVPPEEPVPRTYYAAMLPPVLCYRAPRTPLRPNPRVFWRVTRVTFRFRRYFRQETWVCKLRHATTCYAVMPMPMSMS